jgi:enoyl-CoA hydratase/carnithine racemase
MMAGSGPQPGMGGTGLEAEDREGIRVLRIARPRRRNALSPALITALRAEVERLEDEPDVRAVVITGDDAAFSSGADLKEAEPRLYTEEINAAFNRLEALPKPTIAAIGGWCIAGGLELAMACDLRIAARDAQIGDWHVKINSIGGAGATVRLVRLIGLPAAKDLVFTGRAVDGDEALRLGLVNRVCEPERRLETALALAREIAAHNPVTVANAKGSLNAAVDLDLHGALDHSLALQRDVRRRLGEDDFGRAVFLAREGAADGG